MIHVRLNDGVTEIGLPEVSDCSDAFEAASRLLAHLRYEVSEHGDSAYSAPVTGGFEVRWEGGPVQWADAYVVSEGADGRTFGSHASDDGLGVVFTYLM